MGWCSARVPGSFHCPGRLLSYGPIHQQKQAHALSRGWKKRAAVIKAGLRDDGVRRRRRLIEVVRSIPAATRRYFDSPFRKALFGGISLLGGFYVAQTISLSFGALGVNDVIAAVLCVLFTEYVTRFYYTRPEPTFSVALLNNFKMGFSYGLFIDAFKLAS